MPSLTTAQHVRASNRTRQHGRYRTSNPQVKHVYDGLGRVTSTIEFEGTAQAATTKFAYDDRGLVTETNGPRSGGIDDRTQFAYDGEGRVTSVTKPGVTLPSSSMPVSGHLASEVRCRGWPGRDAH